MKPVIQMDSKPSETDGTENYCANGADDDGDGWTDEDDPDCMTIDGGAGYGRNRSGCQ